MEFCDCRYKKGNMEVMVSQLSPYLYLSPPLLLLFPLDSLPAALRELMEAGQRLGA